MRLLIALPALAVLAACQVSKDDANETVSVTYNADVAENAAADIGNTVENVAGAIGNDVDQAADKVKNTDVDVSVDTNKHDNSH